MKKAEAAASTQKPQAVFTDSTTRVSISCTATDENGADVEVNILELIQSHTTNELEVTFGGTPEQALAMLGRMMKTLQGRVDSELNRNALSRMH
ncbi:hypothetical protein FIP36_16775 [Salmonella enterica]|nr:hypothetical protein [Salmonella enterica]